MEHTNLRTEINIVVFLFQLGHFITFTQTPHINMSLWFPILPTMPFAFLLIVVWLYSTDHANNTINAITLIISQIDN